MSFRAWNTEVVNRIKAGSVKSVLLFGDSDKPRPKPPYAVVKPAPLSGMKMFTIYAHFQLGDEDKLEGYILEELPSLMKGGMAAGADRTVVFDTRVYALGLSISDDDTISGSRDFYIPIIT